MTILPLIAKHLKELGYTDFKLVNKNVLNVGDGAITYDDVWGYCATRNDLKPVLLSYSNTQTELFKGNDTIR